MNKQYKFSKHLDTILKRMCKAVKADFAGIDFKKDGWYRYHSWSEVDEQAFAKWMADYLHANKDAQRELYGRSYMKKSDCRQAAYSFVWNHGWMNKK